MSHYPFTPALLDALPEELAELFRGLEDTLLDEICSRLALKDQLNEVTVQAIRALRSHGIDTKEIEKAIRKTSGISEKKLKELFNDVIARNQKYYTELIDLAHITQPETLVSVEDTWAIYEQTKQTLRNITRSMGFLVNAGRTMLPPAKAYQWALDNAVMQIQSSAINYNQAIKTAVKQLAESGLLLKINTTDGADHFDHRCDAHYHAGCLRCGRVFDVELRQPPQLEKLLGDTHGFTVSGYDLLFRGVCPECGGKTSI